MNKDYINPKQRIDYKQEARIGYMLVSIISGAIGIILLAAFFGAEWWV